MADLTFDQLKQNYALLESDLQDEPKKTIQEGIDIDKDLTLSEAFDKLLENGTSANLWNESIKTAVAHLCSKVLSGATKIPGTEITIADIKNANAGNSFEEDGEWVKPYTNVDGDNYSDVRGNDKIKSVLTNNKNLQYTNETINKYIRLLMPQYTRRVEVEDLNRNFWVIGQTIAGISAYLFDDNSPINTMLKSLISEVNQLWENLLYLWSDQFVTDVHCEVVYLPHNSSITEMKFDDFGESLALTPNTIISRLQYLIQQYPQCHLCIVPVSRASNYIFNYYNKEIYWGIYLYNANSQEWTVYRFANGYAEGSSTNPEPSYGKFLTLYQSKPRGFSIDTSTEKSKQHMTAVYVNELDKKYEIYYPFSELPSSASIKNYYGGLRTTPKLNAIVEEKDGQLQFNVDFDITVRDIGLYLIIGSPSYYEKYSLQNATLITGVEEPEALSITAKVINKDVVPEERENIINIKSGYYLGEMPSINEIIPDINYDINMETVTMIPVMQPLWALVQTGTNKYKEALADNSEQVLTKYGNSNSDQITLYIGQYNCNIFDSNSASKLKNVYYIENNTLKKQDMGGTQNFQKTFYSLNHATTEPTILTDCKINGDVVDNLYYSFDSKVYQNETRDGDNVWNRYRSLDAQGCLISIPGQTPIFVRDYNFWWTYIGAKTVNGNSQFSQAPLYRLKYSESGKQWGDSDTASRGRRGQYWWFGTFYNKKNEKLSTNNWAIKLTEVHMSFAPLINLGYQPASGRADNCSETLTYYYTGSDGSYKSYDMVIGGCFSELGNQNGLYSIYKSNYSDEGSAGYEYAPYYLKGALGNTQGNYTTDKASQVRYFLPMVTMVKTHIFLYDETQENNYKYVRHIWTRIHSDESWNPGGSWIDLEQGGQFIPQGPEGNRKQYYKEVDDLLSSSYQVIKKSSSFKDTAVQSCVSRLLPSEVYKTFKNDAWLDFEHYPLRGFSQNGTL